MELDVFGVAEEDLASSEARLPRCTSVYCPDGLDHEVPDDIEVEIPSGRLMVTVDVSYCRRSFFCKGWVSR